MAEELLVNITPMESRVALIDNGNVNEIYIERQAKLGLVGNIYQGEVVRVLPGMQAAFIEIGLSRTAFLHANDMVSSKIKACEAQNHSELTLNEQAANAVAHLTPNPEPATTFAELIERTKQANAQTPTEEQELRIEERLHEGQKILVQVTKDMLGSKGARLTTDISLPSRFLVYMPYSEHIGISQRIEDDEVRTRLRTTLKAMMTEQGLGGGLIARTAAESASDKQLLNDILYLAQQWQTVLSKQKQTDTGLVFSDLPLPERTVRDLANGDTQDIYIDSTEVYERTKAFAESFAPSIASKIRAYDGEQPLFDAYRVEEDIQKALGRRVELKSGGYLIIDQTEAMTTIDVNTGSFVGGRSLEDTVYKTNLEATNVIARQLRMRNIGGIIIIDFIDMLEEVHKENVLHSLEHQLERDHAKTNITQVSQLGLVEMTRKRTRESLEQQLCEPCATCGGRGFIKTCETVCYEIFREIMRLARAYDKPKQYTIVAHSDVIDMLLSTEAGAVADLEHFIGSVISFQVEASYTQEHYDIVLG